MFLASILVSECPFLVETWTGEKRKRSHAVSVMAMHNASCMTSFVVSRYDESIHGRNVLRGWGNAKFKLSKI